MTPIGAPTAFLGNPTLVAALALTVLILGWIIRRVARSEQPDRILSRVAMLIGLGWSSEAVWELTGRIPQFPTGVRVLLFCVLEILLVVSMIRADRHTREHGWPGRAGTTAWIIACSMGAVAAAVSHSLAEGLLRMAIPLLLTKQWWDGLVGNGARRPEWATSWRWTPRMALLWIGAIEPGERDVQTVNRDRLTAKMVRLEFKRRHRTGRRADRAASTLARLSLDADDEIIAEVRARVDRAGWFTHVQDPSIGSTGQRAITASEAVQQRAARTHHNRRIRTLRITHPAPAGPAAQESFPDERTAQDLDAVVGALCAAFPGSPQRRIAHLAHTTHGRARSAIARIRSNNPTRDLAPSPGTNPARSRQPSPA
jgi:hypothetical protein